MKPSITFDLQSHSARILFPLGLANPICGGFQQVQSRITSLFQEAKTGWLGSTRLWVHLQIGVAAGDKLEESLKALHQDAGVAGAVTPVAAPALAPRVKRQKGLKKLSALAV